MNKKKMCLPLILTVILLVGLAGSVFGATTFVAPTSSSTIDGSFVFNVSSSLAALKNCSITGSSALTGDSMSATWLYNETGTAANATIVTTALSDADDWTFTGTCYNTTGDTASITAITAVTVDNTVPVVTGCTQNGATAVNTTKVDDSRNTIACTIKNATSCSLYWKDTTATPVATGGSDVSCTFTATSSYSASGTSASCEVSQAKDGYNTWYFSCSDGTNSTAGTHYKFQMIGGDDEDDQDGNPIITTQVTTSLMKTTKGKMLMVVFLLLSVVGILLMVLHFGKKK